MKYFRRCDMNTIRWMIALCMFAVGVAFPPASRSITPNPFRELHVSGPCAVELRACPDSIGAVVALDDRPLPPSLSLRRGADALYVILPPDAVIHGRLRLLIYFDPDMRLINAEGRASVKGEGINSTGTLSVVASGPAEVSIGSSFARSINATMTGSGSLRLGTGVTASNVNVSLTGSGKVAVDGLAATKLTATQRGSGRMVISGSAKACAIVLHGSGMVDAHSLIASDLSLALYGEGRIYYPAGMHAHLTGHKDGIKAVKPYQPL